MWFVYILLCADGSFYTGCTNNLEKRLLDHKNGKGGHYTKAKKAIKIIYSEELSTHSNALKREAEIKRWSRNKKIKSFNLQSFQ